MLVDGVAVPDAGGFHDLQPALIPSPALTIIMRFYVKTAPIECSLLHEQLMLSKRPHLDLFLSLYSLARVVRISASRPESGVAFCRFLDADNFLN